MNLKNKACSDSRWKKKGDRKFYAECIPVSGTGPECKAAWKLLSVCREGGGCKVPTFRPAGLHI